MKLLFYTFIIPILFMAAGLSMAGSEKPDHKPLSESSKANKYIVDITAPDMKSVLGEALAATAEKFTGDTMKIIVIPVEWLDPLGARPSTYPSEVLDTFFFSTGVRPYGSVAEYFNEVSYGKLTVVGTVFEWYDLGVYVPACNYSSYYNILEVMDSQMDYTQFDGDFDGMVDGIIYVYSGNGNLDYGSDSGP
jgi:hypothetical protein